jgi:hypothetical protein
MISNFQGTPLLALLEPTSLSLIENLWFQNDGPRAYYGEDGPQLLNVTCTAVSWRRPRFDNFMSFAI